MSCLHNSLEDFLVIFFGNISWSFPTQTSVSLSESPDTPPSHLTTASSSSSFFCNLPSAAHMSICVKQSFGAGATSQKKDDTSHPSSHQLLIVPQRWSLMSPSSVPTGMLTGLTACRKPQLLWIHEDASCSEDNRPYWRVILVADYISSLFCFIAKSYSMEWMCHSLSIHWIIFGLYWTYTRLGMATFSQGLESGSWAPIPIILKYWLLMNSGRNTAFLQLNYQTLSL